jgi:hypothetical protein
MGDPEQTAPIQFYNYLRGIWKDGTLMYYDGTGYYSDPATSDIPTDFMFPGDSDPCGWGQQGQPQAPWDEFTEDNPVGDRRLIQSAGPFTLEPGMVNDITVGAVWARATGGAPFQSVQEVLKADDKAQLLFDNCFKIVNGPDAPEMKIIEMDKQLVFHIYNLPSSNNYLEKYEEKDFSISYVDTNGVPGDKYYRFEGYQVFQLKDASVSIADIHDPDLARLVFQCDIKNGVAQLVNYYWSTELNANEPVMEASGDSMDQGIKHSFTIKEDKFAQQALTLVNYKKYYYLAIAYGYNNYLKYDQNDPTTYQGQKKPYLAGRKSAVGAIKVYEAIPHYNTPQNGGTQLNSSYGAGPKIIQRYGHSGGTNELDLTDETIDQVMSGEPWKASETTYKNGLGPITIKVVDPLNVPDGEYIIKMDSVSFHPYFYRIEDAKWCLSQVSGTVLVENINSETWISSENEQIITELGLSITIGKLEANPKLGNIQMTIFEGSLTYANISKAWLAFLPDGDDANELNWIRAGSQNDPNNPDYNDYYVINQLYDEESVFEKIISGTWAPYKMASHFEYGPAYDTVGCHKLIDFTKGERLSSVDVFITSDTSKWTRCVVVETSENDTTNSGVSIPAMSVVGEAFKFDMRRSPSVDKHGNPAIPGSGSSNNPDDPNYIAEKGMGWFPGYAIDIETGERLNMMYGEASELPGENGRDMMWNPTSNFYSKLGEVLFGGRHFIYVMGHNNQPADCLSSQFPYMPPYDAGWYIHNRLSRFNLQGNMDVKNFKKSVYRNAMWVSIPILLPAYDGMSIDELFGLSSIRIKLRAGTPITASFTDASNYDTAYSNGASNIVNYLKYPEYHFTTSDILTVKNDNETAKEALDLINIVPNPYYGYSPYEENQLDNLVKITNLPQKCTISIYSVNGNLIRRFKKDSQLTYQEWDLKNQYLIPIASGVYIIHIKVDGVGEKILKWFGALRPIDLNAF